MPKHGGFTYAIVTVMEELKEKWTDALDSAESWEEKNLITEFLEDLAWLEKIKD